MIKMALDKYDTLEITIGARLPVGLNRSLASRSCRFSSAKDLRIVP
jgi:hypothetical protein